MKHVPLFATVLASLVTVGACASDDSTGGDATAVSGQAVYRDAHTDHAGQPQAAAAPAPQPVQVSIGVRGNGTLDGVDPTCLDGASGQFQGLYHGEAAIDDGGVYLGSLASTAAQFTTPSGCAIPTLSIGAMTEVVIHAELEATTANCDAYCAASARADAESECGATAGDAACRAEAEASAQASCSATCTSQTHTIAAEATLSADALARLNADGVTGTALGELAVDLVFDRVQ